MLPVQHPANKEGYIADGQPHYSPMAPAVVSSNQYWEGQPDIERQPHAVPTQFASGTHGQAPYVAMGYPANAGPKQFPPHQDVYQQEQVLPSASHQPYFGVSTAIAAGVPQPRRPTVVPGSVAGPSLAPPDSRPQDQSSQPFQPVGQSVAQLFQPNSQTVTQPTQLRLPAGQPFYPASRPAPQPAQPRRVFAPDCTMVIESSQAHKSESAVLAAWAAAGAVSVHVTTAADIAYVNFVSSAQAAAAVDKLNSRQKSDAGKSALKQRAMLKSTQQSYQQLSCQAYLAAKLTAVDEAHFSAAGILLLHRPSKGKPEVLLGHETIHHCRLSMLGGKREKGESSRIAAAREFQEETAYQLESALHLSRQQTSELLDILLADSQVIWLGGKPDGSGNAKYALYLVDICQGISKLPKFQHLQATLSDRMQRLCVKFASSQQHSMWRPINQSEMQSLEWVPLSSRSVLSAPTQSLADFLTMVVKGCQPLRQWAVDVITEHIPAKLQAQVRAAQQQAHLEKPSLHAAIAKLSVAIPPPAAPTTLTDLVTVQPGSAEYNKVKALMSGQVHEIKRVVVPERKARFDAWGLHLASKNASWQKVTKVSSVCKRAFRCLLLLHVLNHC